MTEKDKWNDKPREMWVWNDPDTGGIRKMKVICVLPNRQIPVIAITKSDGSGIGIFRHCSDDDPREENKPEYFD